MLRVCPKTMCYSVLPQFMATCSHLSRDSTMMNRPIWGALSSNKALLETAGSCRIKGLKESATSKSGHKGETMYQIITFMPKETYYPSSNSYTLMYVYIYIYIQYIANKDKQNGHFVSPQQTIAKTHAVKTKEHITIYYLYIPLWYVWKKYWFQISSGHHGLRFNDPQRNPVTNHP